MEHRNPYVPQNEVVDFLKKHEEYENRKRLINREQKEKHDNYSQLTRNILDAVEKEMYRSCESIIGNNRDIIKHKDININALCEEIESLKMKIICAIPKVTIVYIAGSSMALGVFLTIFVLTFLKKIIIIDPFVCFICILGALGLLITSIVSIKDWRRFLQDV